MASIVNDSRITVLDDDGNPESGAKIYFYDAGTSTPRAIYTDAALSVPHTIPIVCDSAGRSPLIFIDPTGGDYKINITDSVDVLIYEDDDISPSLNTPVSIANGGTGATTASGARTALDVPSNTTTDSYNVRINALESTDSVGTVWDYNAQTFAASFTPNIATHNAVSTTLTSNITVNVPTGGTAGKPFLLKFAQDATGSRAITLDSAYKPQGGSINLNWSTGPNAVDILFCQYISGTEIRILSLATEEAELKLLGLLYFDSTSFSTASTSYVDVTGFTIDVTPTSASSTLQIEGMVSYGGAASTEPNLRIQRDSVSISNSDFAERVHNDLVLIRDPFYIEEASTAAASTTFKVQMRTKYSGTVTMNKDGTGTNTATSFIRIYER